MGRPKAVIDATLAEKAEAALKALPDSKVCIRLKAIISSARYPIRLVSSVFGTDRTTLWRWIKRFASKGIAGLADEAKGHRPAKLDPEQRQQVASWLEEGRNSQGEPIFWTLQKLMLAIETEFGISLGQTATWDLVHQLGFKQKAPRPRHTKADKQAQEAFKKNL
ncbi:MAG: transposase [Deltaproteobacteria bacterium]|nr:transposase [Deltaproteobacteria bacterium]